MSKEAKADDHGGEKKSFPMRLVTIAIGILALLIFFYFADATLPQTVSAAASTVSHTGDSLKEFGTGARNFANGVRATSGGVRETFIEFFIILVYVVIVGIVLSYIPKIFAAINKGSHDDHKAPKPADKPAGDKPADKPAGDKPAAAK